MIPKEKIEKAAIEYAQHCSDESDRFFMQYSFKDGAAFAEAELQKWEIDFLYEFALYLDTEHKNFIPTWIIDNFMAERTSQ